MPPKTQKAGQPDSVDQIVENLIEKISKRKKEIKSAEGGSYKGNQLFSYVDGNHSNAINLNTVSDIGKLITMLSFLAALDREYNTVVKEFYGEDAKRTPPFVWHGYQYDTWVNDIKLRISRLRVSEQQAELASWQERLNKLISPERKRRMEAEELANEIE